jgi:limonene-1,2-epoxide hydrolase
MSNPHYSGEGHHDPPVEGWRMSDSPESVVRKFLTAWENPELNKLLSFLTDDAVYIAGPRGAHRGVDAIKSELETQLSMGWQSVTSDVQSLVADGGTVMMERVDSVHFGDNEFPLEMMAAFEIDADGRIKRCRDSFDLNSFTDQIEAAGIRISA